MTEEFTPLVSNFLRECSTCGAAVSDQRGHRAWHERLRAVITNGPETIDPVDLDQ